MANIIQLILHPHTAALSYTAIFLSLGYLCIHYRWLAQYLGGVFLHMFIVAMRVVLFVLWPETALWGWADIHRTTALIAAGCGVWLLIQIQRGRV